MVNHNRDTKFLGKSQKEVFKAVVEELLPCWS